MKWLKRLFCKHKSTRVLFEDCQQDRYMIEKCVQCGKIIYSDL
jgi:hypothetical protein